MTVMDLVGTLAFLGTILFLIGALGALLVAVARRRWPGARRIGIGIGVFLALYVAALLIASLLSHDRLLGFDQRRCFDDWCVAVVGAQRASTSGDAAAGGDLLVVTLRVSSQARRISQRPSQPRFWVEDAQGRKYAASPEGQLAWERTHGPSRPVDDRIGPGENFTTPLVFAVPPAADDPTFVVTEGPGWLGRLIIGSEESPFHKRTRFPLQAP